MIFVFLSVLFSMIMTLACIRYYFIILPVVAFYFVPAIWLTQFGILSFSEFIFVLVATDATLSWVHLLILCVTSLRNFAISFLLSSALWSIVCFHNRWRNQGSGSLTELPSTTQLVGFPGGLNGKESTCNEETWVGSLHWVDPLEKGMATHSSILTWSYSGLYWSIPWTEEPGGLYSMESQRVGHDWATITFTFHTTNRWQAEDFNFCFSDIVSSFWQEVPWSCH